MLNISIWCWQWLLNVRTKLDAWRISISTIAEGEFRHLSNNINNDDTYCCIHGEWGDNATMAEYKRLCTNANQSFAKRTRIACCSCNNTWGVFRFYSHFASCTLYTTINKDSHVSNGIYGQPNLLMPWSFLIKSLRLDIKEAFADASLFILRWTNIRIDYYFVAKQLWFEEDKSQQTFKFTRIDVVNS